MSGGVVAERVRTADVVNEATRGTEFRHLALKEEVKRGLGKAGYDRPTPIQMKAIPLGLLGVDMVVKSKAGTGKTLVFAVLTLQAVDTSSALPQSITITATREIALQIAGVIAAVGCELPNLQCHTFIGGTQLRDDKTRLRKCQVVVGSPGRVQNLIESSLLFVNKVKLFCLDEVDALLMGTETHASTNAIFRCLPERKQVCTFSATYTPALMETLNTYMRTPRVVEIEDPKVSLRGVTEYCKVVSSRETRLEQVMQVLNSVAFTQCIVFLNDFEESQGLVCALCERGIAANCISAKLEQRDRTEIITKFAQFNIRVLVSSDLTSRGIDMTKVNLVISLDIPPHCETYMHRIGRTGRYGSLGIAIAIITKQEHALLVKCRKELGADSPLIALPKNLADLTTEHMQGVLTSEEDLKKFGLYETSRKDQTAVAAPHAARRSAKRRRGGSDDGMSTASSSEEEEEDEDEEDADDEEAGGGGDNQATAQTSAGVCAAPAAPVAAGEAVQGPAKRARKARGGAAEEKAPMGPTPAPWGGAAAAPLGGGGVQQQQQQQCFWIPQQAWPAGPSAAAEAVAGGVPAAPWSGGAVADKSQWLHEMHTRLCRYYDRYYSAYYAVAADCVRQASGLPPQGALSAAPSPLPPF